VVGVPTPQSVCSRMASIILSYYVRIHQRKYKQWMAGGGNRGTGTAHTSKHTRARALTYYSRIIYYYNIVEDEDYIDDEELRKTKSTEDRATTNNTHTRMHSALTHAMCIKRCESFNSRTHTHPQSALLLLQPSAVLIMHEAQYNTT